MRLFVGIALTEAARAALGRLAGGIRGARWLEPQNLHLTLYFAGEIEPGTAEDLDAALTMVEAPAFELTLSGIGVFERRGRVHAAWAGVAAERALTYLKERIDGALAQAGFEPEHRKFKPHVTLARMKNVPVADVTPWLEIHGAFAAEPYEVAAFHLYRSHLGRAGAHYEPLVDYPLESLAGAGGDQMD